MKKWPKILHIIILMLHNYRHHHKLPMVHCRMKTSLQLFKNSFLHLLFFFFFSFSILRPAFQPSAFIALCPSRNPSPSKTVFFFTSVDLVFDSRCRNYVKFDRTRCFFSVVRNVPNGLIFFSFPSPIQ